MLKTNLIIIQRFNRSLQHKIEDKKNDNLLDFSTEFFIFWAGKWGTEIKISFELEGEYSSFSGADIPALHLTARAHVAYASL